ncbi:MarR family transcriptional regulator [Mycolicibacterium sp. Y3]
MPVPKSLPLFTPSLATRAELDILTVGREDLLGRLVDRIQSAAHSGSRPHSLLLGPSGAGKTHTLQVALHHALSVDTSADRVLPVVVPEDSVAIGRYADLLVEIAREVDPQVQRAALVLRQQGDAVGIEEQLLNAAAGRTILLVIENLDRVFGALREAGQGSFRAWVETSAAIMVLASSPALFAGISSRTRPWYGSFMVEMLPEMTVDEVGVLLEHDARLTDKPWLAELLATSAGRTAIAEIHARIGGLPRLWHHLVSMATAEQLIEVELAVEIVLDQITQFYQPRLWSLPAGQLRFVAALARSEGPRTVRELAEAVGASSQSASTALGRLSAARWVHSVESSADRRVSLYDLTDPVVRLLVQYRERSPLS